MAHEFESLKYSKCAAYARVAIFPLYSNILWHILFSPHCYLMTPFFPPLWSTVICSRVGTKTLENTSQSQMPVKCYLFIFSQSVEWITVVSPAVKIKMITFSAHQSTSTLLSGLLNVQLSRLFLLMTPFLPPASCKGSCSQSTIILCETSGHEVRNLRSRHKTLAKWIS